MHLQAYKMFYTVEHRYENIQELRYCDIYVRAAAAQKNTTFFIY